MMSRVANNKWLIVMQENHQMLLLSKKIYQKMQGKQKVLQKTRETKPSSGSSTLIPFKEKGEDDYHVLL